ncbi:hypothetical protein Tco_1539840 [Tanacetum coccineum]
MSDAFGQVCLPAGRLVRTNKFTISKVYETLGLSSATKSFTKMLSIEAPDTWMSYRVLELRKNGEAIIENIDDTITNYSFCNLKLWSLVSVKIVSSEFGELMDDHYSIFYEFRYWNNPNGLLDPRQLLYIKSSYCFYSSIVGYKNEMVFGSGLFFVVALVCMECFKNFCSTVGSLASMFYVCLGVTVYIPPPPYPAPEELGMIVVAVGYCFIGIDVLSNIVSGFTLLFAGESQLSKKARGSGDGEVRLAANVKKVAEILLVLATMVEMRDGRKATSVEVEMMIEARRKLVEICEEFGPKDVFGNDVFGIIVDDLGLGRMKETKLAACFPKMSIGEKLDVTKVKMEEDEFYSPRATEVRAASHGVRKSLSGKPDFQHHPTMAHALRVSDSVNLPFELLTSEARRGGSNASTNSPLGKHSTVQHHMNLVQAPTHEENAHMPKPDHKTWTVPSTNDCMNKVLTCQTCECVINEMYGALICDACESACHLRIKLECNQQDEMREDEEGVKRGNFVKTSETCTAVEENEGSVSSSMQLIERRIINLAVSMEPHISFNSMLYSALPAKILCLVYESNYQLTLPAGSIHGPCEVLPPKKFSKERAMQSRAQTTADGFMHKDGCFEMLPGGGGGGMVDDGGGKFEGGGWLFGGGGSILEDGRGGASRGCE